MNKYLCILAGMMILFKLAASEKSTTSVVLFLEPVSIQSSVATKKDASLAHSFYYSMHSSIIANDQFSLTSYSTFLDYCSEKFLNPELTIRQLNETRLSEIGERVWCDIIIYTRYSIKNRQMLIKVEVFDVHTGLNSQLLEKTFPVNESAFDTISLTCREAIAKLSNHISHNIVKETKKSSNSPILKQRFKIGQTYPVQKYHTLKLLSGSMIGVCTSLMLFSLPVFYLSTVLFNLSGISSSISMNIFQIGFFGSGLLGVAGSFILVGFIIPLIIFIAVAINNQRRWHRWGEMDKQGYIHWLKMKRKISLKPVVNGVYKNGKSLINFGLAVSF